MFSGVEAKRAKLYPVYVENKPVQYGFTQPKTRVECRKCCIQIEMQYAKKKATVIG